MSKPRAPGKPSQRRFRRRLAIAAFTVAVGGMIVHLPSLVALLVVSTFGLLALGVLVRLLVAWPDDPAAQRRIFKWTIAAFAVHLSLGIVVMSSETLRSYLATDSYIYHSIAQDIVAHWTAGLPLPTVPGGKEGFYYLLAGLYWVFGAHTSAGLAVNATFAAALIPIVTNTTEQLYDREAAQRVPPLVFLLPSIFILTSQLLKEAAVLLLIVIAANGAVRLNQRFTPARLAAVAVPIALLLTFRAWIAVVVAQGLVVGVALGKGRVISAAGTAFGMLALLALLVIPLGVGYSGYQTAITADLRQANVVRQDLALSANSGFAADVDISTSERALSYLPTGMLNVALGPFPWQVGGVRQLPGLVDVVVIWALLPSLARGYRAARKRTGWQLLVVVLPALATLCLLALSIGNFGTISRERMQIFVLLAPLMAAGLAARRAKRHAEPTSAVVPVAA